MVVATGVVMAAATAAVMVAATAAVMVAATAAVMAAKVAARVARAAKVARADMRARYTLRCSGWLGRSATTQQPILAETCGQDVADIASVPIDQYQQVIQPPTDAQRAALDELAAAASKAAQDIKAACPTELALTAPGRLAAMQQRVEAMIAGVQTIQSPLEKFYGLLNDEQKAKVNTLGGDQHPSDGRSRPTKETEVAQNCSPTQLGEMQLPNAEIDKTVRPTDEQKMILVGLQNATTQAAADLIKSTCVASNPLTPAAKLAAVGKRLETMLEADQARAERRSTTSMERCPTNRRRNSRRSVRKQRATNEDESEELGRRTGRETSPQDILPASGPEHWEHPPAVAVLGLEKHRARPQSGCARFSVCFLKSAGEPAGYNCETTASSRLARRGIRGGAVTAAFAISLAPAE